MSSLGSWGMRGIVAERGGGLGGEDVQGFAFGGGEVDRFSCGVLVAICTRVFVLSTTSSIYMLTTERDIRILDFVGFWGLEGV